MADTPQLKQFTDALKEEARRCGFSLVGACPAVTPAGYPRLVQWLEAGRAGDLHYIRSRLDAYRYPDSILPGVQSLLMLGLSYRTVEPRRPAAGQGRVARYAWSPRDYHDVIHEKLRALASWVRTARPTVRTRGVVDTAPLLEREFGALAGLGWIAKNTMLINRQYGSWFFLAALLLDCKLDYNSPLSTSHCGTCTACLDACPTGALVTPGVLDARKCISCWTIETRGPLPVEQRAELGAWVFGCDVCQDVCPWNRKAQTAPDDTFVPRADLNPAQVSDWLPLDEPAVRTAFRKTALWRSRRTGLLRNAALVLGNSPHKSATSALLAGLKDPDPVVRGACAWALGRGG